MDQVFWTVLVGVNVWSATTYGSWGAGIAATTAAFCGFCLAGAL